MAVGLLCNGALGPKLRCSSPESLRGTPSQYCSTKVTPQLYFILGVEGKSANLKGKKMIPNDNSRSTDDLPRAVKHGMVGVNLFLLLPLTCREITACDYLNYHK